MPASAREAPAGVAAGVRERIGRLLSHPRAALFIVGCALALASPYLVVGGNVDDYWHTVSLQRPANVGGMQRAPWDLYAFATPETNRALMEQGVFPWWTDPELVVSFYRPLSSLLRSLDHLLWPDSFVLMHLHGLVWYALLLCAALLVYRGLALSPRHGALALLLFALDDARSGPVAWIAQRHALIALFPAFCALAAHRRWRAGGPAYYAWIAPACLFAALQGGESALSVCGYLVAYAVVLEPGSWRARARSLLPYLVALLAWGAVYVHLGRGALHSGLYIDPAREPLAFLQALLVRLPILLLSEFAFPFSDLWEAYPLISPWLRPLALLSSALVLGGLWLLLRPLLRAHAVLRFWLLGMLLAALPACCIHAQDRMLTPISLGGAALISAFLLSGLESFYPRASRVAAASAGALWIVHALVGPLLLPIRSFDMAAAERLFIHADRSIPSGPELAQQTLVLLNPPVELFAVWFQPYRAQRQIQRPQRFRSLATAESELHVERLDARTLKLRPAHGFLATSTQTLFRRADRSLRAGESVALDGVELSVTGMTPDGRPAEVNARFREPLESASLRFMQWRDHAYEPFTPPAIGAAVVIPAADIMASLFKFAGG